MADLIPAAAFELLRVAAIWGTCENYFAETMGRRLQDIVTELTFSEVVAVPTTAQLKRLGEMSEFKGTVYVMKGVDEEEIHKYSCRHYYNVVYRNVEFRT